MSKTILITTILTATGIASLWMWSAPDSSAQDRGTPHAKPERQAAANGAHGDRFDASESSPDEAAEVAALRGELRSLLAQIETDGAPRSAAVDVEAEPDAGAESVARPDPRAIAEAELEWGGDYAAQLDEQLDAEPVDHAWASEGEALAKASFAALGAESVVGTAQCRSTLCRVEISHDAESGHDSAVTAIRDDRTWTGPFIAIPMNDGSGPKTVVYLGREGESMPSPRSSVEDFLDQG
jgi:hypothetical protein